MANPNAPRQRGLPQIAQLPTAGALDGTELFETAQNYQPVKVSLAALAAYIGGGGGGAPGGANTEVQYNNAGAFGGIASWTFAGGVLTATGNVFAADGGAGGIVLFGSNASGDYSTFWPDINPLGYASSQVVTCDGNGIMLISAETLTDGTAAQLATLTNAPAAGDPTKWIPIDDNGTTRFIPAW